MNRKEVGVGEHGTPEERRTLLKDKATRLRIHSIRSTSEAGSGHPSSCASAAEIVASLFFAVMRYNPRRPEAPENDTFILSKGHAAPLLYAAWAEAGYISPESLLRLRTLNSDLEGHPTPRIPFAEVATGSLGQGLSVGLGMALYHKYLAPGPQRTYVLMGDGESAEGSVWEAAELASYYKLDNLCAIVDVNRLGQSEATMYGHDLAVYKTRWFAFGWNAIVVDGHNTEELLEAFSVAASTTNQPSVLLAHTIKGKGISEVEDKNGYHGKPLQPEVAEKALRDLEHQTTGRLIPWSPKLPNEESLEVETAPLAKVPDPPYKANSEPVATRKACSASLAALGKVNPRIVVMDGDVKNSTYTQDFQKECPDRFFQMFIAEQNLVGAVMGLAAKRVIPFVSTFASFLTRAHDFIRMASISGSNIKLTGSHAGVSIGEDGPSQMGLEDLAMFCAQPNFCVLYPSDGVSAWRAAQLAAAHTGPAYIRTSRPETPILYGPDEQFEIGKCKILRKSDRDQLAIIAAGITVFEALDAHEQLLREGIHARVIDIFSVQPIDRDVLRECAEAVHGRIITVEDHYQHGGIGDAALSALTGEGLPLYLRKLAVRETPRSGSPAELLERYGISARHILEAARSMTDTPAMEPLSRNPRKEQRYG